MKKMLAVTTAAAALMFAVPSFAQDTTSNTGGTTGNMYVTGEGENMMVMGGDNAEGARVLRGENFAQPEDCPEGSYYMSAENQITACGEGGASFDVTTEAGEGMPEGAMALQPRESGEQKQSDSGNQNDDGDQGDDESGNQGEGNTDSEGGGDANEGGGSGGGNNGGGSGGGNKAAVRAADRA
jgi:uncharacterized membrane protein YgcG